MAVARLEGDGGQDAVPLRGEGPCFQPLAAGGDGGAVIPLDDIPLALPAKPHRPVHEKQAVRGRGHQRFVQEPVKDQGLFPRGGLVGVIALERQIIEVVPQGRRPPIRRLQGRVDLGVVLVELSPDKIVCGLPLAEAVIFRVIACHEHPSS